MRQDRQGVRTPTDIEIKYNLRNFASQSKLNEERLNSIVQSLSVLEKLTRNIQTELEAAKQELNILSDVKADKADTYLKTEIDLMLEQVKALIPGYTAVAILDESLLDNCVLA